jgi:hypothetical protein
MNSLPAIEELPLTKLFTTHAQRSKFTSRLDVVKAALPLIELVHPILILSSKWIQVLSGDSWVTTSLLYVFKKDMYNLLVNRMKFALTYKAGTPLQNKNYLEAITTMKNYMASFKKYFGDFLDEVLALDITVKAPSYNELYLTSGFLDPRVFLEMSKSERQMAKECLIKKFESIAERLFQRVDKNCCVDEDVVVETQRQEVVEEAREIIFELEDDDDDDDGILNLSIPPTNMNSKDLERLHLSNKWREEITLDIKKYVDAIKNVVTLHLRSYTCLSQESIMDDLMEELDPLIFFPKYCQGLYKLLYIAQHEHSQKASSADAERFFKVSYLILLLILKT